MARASSHTQQYIDQIGRASSRSSRQTAVQVLNTRTVDGLIGYFLFPGIWGAITIAAVMGRCRLRNLKLA